MWQFLQLEELDFGGCYVMLSNQYRYQARRCSSKTQIQGGFVVLLLKLWTPKQEEIKTPPLLLLLKRIWYVAKLGMGSFVGAAAIKYGSALFPQITTPNLVLALIIISTPVIVAVLLLINQSRLNP